MTARPDSSSPDPYDLHRFIEAQESNYAEALAELRAGRKQTHWSWYVLPQIRGLGASPMSIRYAISGLSEAGAYLQHRVLGNRLLETIAALDRHDGPSAAQILGSVDAQKLKSCLTLFGMVPSAGPQFRDSLAKYFAAEQDPLTIAILRRQSSDGVR